MSNSQEYFLIDRKQISMLRSVLSSLPYAEVCGAIDMLDHLPYTILEDEDEPPVSLQDYVNGGGEAPLGAMLEERS